MALMSTYDIEYMFWWNGHKCTTFGQASTVTHTHTHTAHSGHFLTFTVATWLECRPWGCFPLSLSLVISLLVFFYLSRLSSISFPFLWGKRLSGSRFSTLCLSSAGIIRTRRLVDRGGSCHHRHDDSPCWAWPVWMAFCRILSLCCSKKFSFSGGWNADTQTHRHSANSEYEGKARTTTNMYVEKASLPFDLHSSAY